jgi:hypothetical protein
MAGPAPASPAPRLAVRVASPPYAAVTIFSGTCSPRAAAPAAVFQSGIPAGCDFLLRVQNFIYHVDFV